MERIGGGWSKHVYALNKDQVLKVPRKEVGEFGRYSMRAETWMWENVPDEHRFWLADVIAYDRQGNVRRSYGFRHQRGQVSQPWKA